MPPGRDEELAVIFKEMRRALDMSMEQISSRLATSADTIAGLESGALRALPETSEHKRIVTAYANLLGLDARPIQRRIEAQIDLTQPPVMPAAPPAPPAPPQGANKAPPRAAPMPPSVRPTTAPPQPPGQSAPPQQPPPQQPRQAPRAAPRPQPAPATASAQPRHGATPRETEKKPESGRHARKLRSVLNWIILLGFVAALGAGVRYAAMNPRAVWSAFDTLPEPVPRLIRSAWELLRPLEATGPQPQVSDPDNRKSDKLR